MAKPIQKQAIEPSAAPVDEIMIAPDIDLESAIADELLDSLDWGKVKAAMLTKVKHRFFAWLTSGSNTAVNLLPYPELAALPDAEEQEKAA